MKGINRGCSRRFGSGGGHARMCGQGSHLRAPKDNKVPGKEPGRESPSRTKQHACAKALRSESGPAKHREGEDEHS